MEHINWLENNFSNVKGQEVDLTEIFNSYSKNLPLEVQDDLSMANLRLSRMSNLYLLPPNKKYLVAGTGNKVEDFGGGFYTKYGDGGVDISPDIADLYKSEVFQIAKHLDIINSIQNALPTDGLWDDDRTDEDQLGASYDELEWAMKYLDNSDKETLSDRQIKVLEIYNHYHSVNGHKMQSIPVCTKFLRI